MPSLSGKVALVTGASRGVGKGVAIGLGEAGARVYVTGRTLTSVDGEGSLEATAAQFAPLAGDCVCIQCDHTNDAQTEAVFAQISQEAGQLDLLVNTVWGGYERMIEHSEFTWPRPFWEQPVWRWNAMFEAGVRAAFVCSQFATRQMIEQRSGLIVNISDWAAQKYIGNAIYGAAKCATDRLTRDMALELTDKGVFVISVYPGLVRTEKVLESAEFLDLSNSESPQFTGRAIAHLLLDPQLQRRNGTVLTSADLAAEFGFTDIDGKVPRPLTLQSA